MSLLADYLNHVRLVKASGLASDERSYYPALDALFNVPGAMLAPKVIAIHDVRDVGAGHPDYLLQVETTHDTRAAIEAKPASADVNAIMRSEQVRRYLRQYGLCLVTNLRHFSLARVARNNQVVEIMRYELAASEDDFWNTPFRALVSRHDDGMPDFLI